MYIVFVMVKFGNKIECYKQTLRVCSSILCVSVYMFVWFKKFLVGMFSIKACMSALPGVTAGSL